MIKYQLEWHDENAVNIEMMMIRAGGYLTIGGVKCGHGLFHHFKAFQMLLWPTNDHHRWSDLILSEILANRTTVIVGSRDCGKTHGMAAYALADYFVYPNETLTLMSSTHGQGLQLRVWGEVKDLFLRAKEAFSWLPGNIVESKFGIFTDALGPGATIRDMRKALICIACGKGDEESIDTLMKFCGAKQKRRRLLGDELHAMPGGYLNVFSNLDKGDFKGVFGGNPIGQGDPLDRLSEPICGWSNQPEPTKTIVWENKLGGRTINLVGTDSPNFDAPRDKPFPYPYLLDPDDEQRVLKRYGSDSMQYWSQIKGVRKPGLMAHRILTMDICKRFGAFDPCIWESNTTTKIYALDAAFGGDRPVGGMIEFGRDVKGRNVIKVFPPHNLPLRVSSQETPEEQLANTMREECRALGIPPENVFYDAGMRATLAVEIGRLFSTLCNAVNFGGPATDRPVSADDYIYDQKEQRRRLKKCSEAYSKFVTELNYSVRMIVEAGQIREMPESVVREFELREWYTVSGDRIELETKAETRKRMGYSPDESDWCSIACEGARRRGFIIEGLKETSVEIDQEATQWLEKEHAKFKTFVKKYQINYNQ